MLTLYCNLSLVLGCSCKRGKTVNTPNWHIAQHINFRQFFYLFQHLMRFGTLVANKMGNLSEIQLAGLELHASRYRFVNFDSLFTRMFTCMFSITFVIVIFRFFVQSENNNNPILIYHQELPSRASSVNNIFSPVFHRKQHNNLSQRYCFIQIKYNMYLPFNQNANGKKLSLFDMFNRIA